MHLTVTGLLGQAPGSALPSDHPSRPALAPALNLDDDAAPGSFDACGLRRHYDGFHPRHPLATALWFCSRGFWPIPVYSIYHCRYANHACDIGKLPIGMGWGLTRHTDASLRAVYDRYSGAGVALRLGGDGGLIDLDVDEPEAAAPALARIFPAGIPDTLGWRTARGFHLLFRWDDRCAQYGQTRIDGAPHYPGIEIKLGPPRDDPRQLCAVVPPSLLPDGRKRAWNASRQILPVPDSLLADLDAHIGSAPKTAVRTATPAPARPVADLDRWMERARQYARTVLRNECERVQTATAGRRNIQLNTSAFHVGGLVPRFLTEHTVRAELVAAGIATGLPEWEVDQTVSIAIADGQASPWEPRIDDVTRVRKPKRTAAERAERQAADLAAMLASAEAMHRTMSEGI